MKTKLTWFDRLMTAVTFAEANEPVQANHFMAGTESRTVKKQKCHECEVIMTTDLHGAEAQ